MVKVLNMIGLPVRNQATGETIGSVCDLLFDDHWKVHGIVIDAVGWFSKGRFIPLHHIHAFGDDALIVASDGAVTPLEHGHPYMSMMTGKTKIKGIEVITEEGNGLGRIEDVYFLKEMGTLVGYELSDGLISDLTQGRKLLRRPAHSTLSDDALIVPVSSEEDVGDLLGGI